MYSMDFESLENLLDNWIARDCDPIWMVRKAALLWETHRNDEAADLITDALESIRAIPGVEGSVAGESREGWAMWSAVTIDEWQEFRKRWHELAALKCDAELEKDLIARRLKGDGDEQEAPTFDLEFGTRREHSIFLCKTRTRRIQSSTSFRSRRVAPCYKSRWAHRSYCGLRTFSDLLQSCWRRANLSLQFG